MIRQHIIKRRILVLGAIVALPFIMNLVQLLLNEDITLSWELMLQADEATSGNFYPYAPSFTSSVRSRKKEEVILTLPADRRSHDVVSIDRMYFFNSFINPLRREFMLSWLKQQSVPFQRVESISTYHSECDNTTATNMTKSDCHRQVEMALSYLYLGYHGFEIDGSSMIPQDDTVSFQESFWQSLSETIQEIPSNTWDVIRLDCREHDESSLSDHGVESMINYHHGKPKWFRQQGNLTCYRSNAILWRKRSLHNLKKKFPNPSSGLDKVSKRLHEKQFDIDCLLSDDTFETYCVNLNITHSNDAIPELKDSVVENAWFPSEWSTRVSAEDIRNQTNYISRHQNFSITTTANNVQNRSRLQDDIHIKIDRIYYLNLPKNKLRSQVMDLWLKDQPIPSKRIEAIVGDINSCVERHNNTNRCKGISGINQSFLRILEQENTTGITMVLEDDIIPIDPNLDRLLEAIQLVPSDWDIIRVDCWGLTQFEFPRWITTFLVDTTEYWKKSFCKTKNKCLDKLYGGAFSMLWKDTSIEKLKFIWSIRPYDDADGQIAGRKNLNLKSYCLNIGLWDHLYIRNSWSDASLLTE